MSDKRQCKSCRTPVVDVDIDVQIDNANTVDEETYEKRLEICMECPSLVYGSTCKHSGCLVSYRTYLKDKKCPEPSGAKW
ncbi:DUF6171 family protein [Bacillus alkalicellulosilyticus]|uniref:DUF6171 family protein n=1 Tax=Alkalihalobacterium alkalicellulosilyticum TaxID=1912214 RepID=UPI001116B9ED|nr:DUF6171 family protein [Bacillus alkalicellulosilyticus]